MVRGTAGPRLECSQEDPTLEAVLLWDIPPLLSFILSSFFRLKTNTESSNLVLKPKQWLMCITQMIIRVVQVLLTKYYCCVVFCLCFFSPAGYCFWTEMICMSLRSWAVWKTFWSNSNTVLPSVFLLPFASYFLMLFIQNTTCCQGQCWPFETSPCPWSSCTY